MKLTVRDFKSVTHVDGFSFSPLTMLAGVNSSGKTSLVQALLLLKQTLDGDSKKPLQLQGPYIYADSLTDLVFKKNSKGAVFFAMEFDAEEILNRDDFDKYLAFNGDPLSGIVLAVSFTANGEPHVKGLECELLYGNSGRETFQVVRRNDLYDISFSSTTLFGGYFGLATRRKNMKGCMLEFTNFIPLYGNSPSICNAHNRHVLRRCGLLCL